ncbi:MAG: glycerophosphodiester phosphodiesterase [Myxococcales bacterium]|nr:glycerophosphodiester phosphodiesterase [Myxococcales bacterium]
MLTRRRHRPLSLPNASPRTGCGTPRTAWVAPVLLALAACGPDGANRADTGDGALADVDAAIDTTGDAADGGTTDAPDRVDADDAAQLDPDTDVAADGSGEAPVSGPPFEVRVQAVPPTADALYGSEETTRYRAAVGASLSDVEAIAASEDRVFIGAAAGIAELDWERGRFVPRPDVSSEATHDLQLSPDGTLWAATDAGVLRWVSGDVAELLATDAAATSVAHAGGATFVVVDGALLQRDGDAWAAVDVPAGAVSRVRAATEGAIAAGPGGVWSLDASGNATPLTDRAAVDVAGCPDGAVAIATDSELLIVRDGETTRIDPGPGGLPTDAATSVACADGLVALGHAVGATVLDPGLTHVDHYQSERWLLDDRVPGVALDSGRRWFATAAGVTRVDLVPRTLHGKAAAFLYRHGRYFWRLGGFSSAWAHTPDPYSFDGLSLGDDDNDGQWTEETIGALAFAAGATGDRRFCDAARPAVRNMRLLVDVPCVSFADAGRECGFVARTFVRDDEGPLFDGKAGLSNWHEVELDGRRYRWKDDTSSDELAGHFFGLPLYYDLCATDAEREQIASTLQRITDTILAHDLYLVDLDGLPTEHGNWGHDYVASCVDGFGNCDATDLGLCASACFGGGFLNGAEILGQLLATWHVTGDARYYDEYERLAVEERYADVVRFSSNVLTATNPSVENHVDHELAMLAFHTLIRYEPNADRRAAWQQALLGLYETELDEENPFWAAFVAGLTGEERQRDAALQSLREYPLDTRFWRIDHSHRLDVSVRPEPDRFGEPQLGEWPPPYDEQPARWWDQTPYAVVRDGDGRSMRGPMAYLIAYWAARYYGLLDAPATRENPLLRDEFLLIAHRGGGALEPEATRAAYDNALAVGADVLECDAHSTADGVIVCIHDDTVDRTTDGTGRVHDLTLTELRALDAGFRWRESSGAPRRGQGLTIPTLHELLTAYPDTPWTIELKQGTPSIAEAVVDLVEDTGHTGDVVLVSFLQPALDEARGANPDIVTGLTAGEMVQLSALDERSAATYSPPGLVVQAPYSSTGSDALAPGPLALAHSLGMRVHVWTVNERDELTDALDRGADGIFTDDPALLQELLVERGLRGE